MTEQDYIEQLEARFPHTLESIEPTVQTIKLCDQAVQAHPHSAKLWSLRGGLLQLARYDTGYALEESAICFVMAIRAEPHDPAHYVELGHFLEDVMNNPRKAKQYFNKARLLRRALAYPVMTETRKAA